METMGKNDKGKGKIGEESRRDGKKKEEGSRRKEDEKNDDDVCLTCKDGGLLVICDYDNCNKAYHPDCVGKDPKYIRSQKSWICHLHFCFCCLESPEFHCVCCSKALCSQCVEVVEFVQVKGDKGFCSVCLKLALHVEETVDADFDAPPVALFREFWKINSKRECLTLEDLRSADARMKLGKCYVSSSDSEERDDVRLNDERTSDSDKAYQMIKRRKPMKKGSKGKAHMAQRNKTPKRKEFVGWGSRVLIDFLKSIDIDVAQAMPQKVVTAHIKDYIKENNLFDPEKKKRIICDTKLQTVLGRKTVKESKIFYLLECHLADNQPSSDEDAIRFDSKEKVDDDVVCNSRGNSYTDGTFLERNKMMGCSISQPQFASINQKNISLVYLRQGLVLKFMEEIETFDDKVVGSFVKFKTNPKERRFQNPFKLVQVTGTTRTLTAENDLKILLKVSGVEKDICINVLSNGDVSEEECYELKVCIQEGVLKHPTVAELQQKAMDLHKDIVKHWIARELVIVQEHIDRANEKGWKKQLHEKLERREWLRSSDEQEKLLNTIPQVVADEGGEITPDLCHVGILETPRHESEGGGQAVMDRDFPEGIKIGSNNDDGFGQGNDQNNAATVTKGGQAVMDRDLSRGIKVSSDNDDGTEQRNYQKIAEKVTKGDPTLICLSSSSEDTMGPTNIDEIGLERDESSAAKDSEVRKGNEHDGPDEQLEAILKNLPFGSNVEKSPGFNLVRKGNEHDGPDEQLEAILKNLPYGSNVEKSPGFNLVRKGNEHNGPDEQLEAILKNLPYGSDVEKSPGFNLVHNGIECDGPDEQLGAISKSLPCGSHVVASRKLELVDPANSLWNCIVSDGKVKGPCTLSYLRSYADFDPAFLKYKVWVAGQSKETAITLDFHGVILVQWLNPNGHLSHAKWIRATLVQRLNS